MEQPTPQEPTAEPGVNVSVEPNQEPNELDLMKQEIQALKDGFKKEISGLNRKNSELEKEKTDLERQGLEEQERIKLELDDMKEAKLKEEQELTQLRRERTIESALVSAELPIQLARRINGSSDEEINSDIAEMKEFIQKISEEKAEKIVNERLGGKPPVQGKTPDGTTMKQADFKLLDPEEQMKFMKGGGITYK